MCVHPVRDSAYAAVVFDEREKRVADFSRRERQVAEDLPDELLSVVRVDGHQRHQLDLVEEHDPLRRVQPGHHALGGDGITMAAPESVDAGGSRTDRHPYRSRGIHGTAQLLAVDVLCPRKPHPLHGSPRHHGECTRAPRLGERFDDIVDAAQIGVGFRCPHDQCGVGLVEPVAQPGFGSLGADRRAVQYQCNRLTEFGLTAPKYLGPLGRIMSMTL